MINQQLLDFIKGQLQLGVTKEKITSELLANGWELKDVEEGFKDIVSPIAPTNPSNFNSVNVFPKTDNSNTLKSSKQKNSHFIYKIILIVIALFLLWWISPFFRVYFYIIENTFSQNNVLSISVSSPSSDKTFKTGDVVTTEWTYITDCKGVRMIFCKPPFFSIDLEKKEVSNGKTYNENYKYLIENFQGSSYQWIVSDSIPSGIYDVKVCQLICESSPSFNVVYDSSVSAITTHTAVDIAAVKAQGESLSPTEQEKGIKASMNNIRAEGFGYDSSTNNSPYSGFCLSKEAKIAFNQIKEMGGTDLVCKDSAKTFAVGVNFSIPTPKSWCVDSVNAAHITSVFPTGALCP